MNRDRTIDVLCKATLDRGTPEQRQTLLDARGKIRVALLFFPSFSAAQGLVCQTLSYAGQVE